jgi:hypothetical protein
MVLACGLFIGSGTLSVAIVNCRKGRRGALREEKWRVFSENVKSG